MRTRTRARAWVLQMLYAWESRGSVGSLAAVRDAFFRDRRVNESSRHYITQLCDVLDAYLPGIDTAIEAALTNWRLERLSAIDRNVLRIGTAEMLYVPDVPARVALQEAIQLAEKYGTEESPRFVNGVLDALLHGAGSGTGDAPEARR
jgi:transcription antitermination protein NusB